MLKQAPPSPPERDHYLPPDVVQNAQLRLNRLAGHVRAVEQMLAEGRDHVELLMQLIAVRAALTQVTVHLMKAHMETCLRMIQGPEDQRQALDRLGAALAAALGEEQ